MEILRARYRDPFAMRDGRWRSFLWKFWFDEVGSRFSFDSHGEFFKYVVFFLRNQQLYMRFHYWQSILLH